MNYRHPFHAGNFADVFKHSLLAILLQALNRKPASWCYYDTHAGAGLYDLQGDEARRAGESAGGIERLWAARKSAPAPVAELCAAVAAVNPGLADNALPRFYPGSPLIAAGLARDYDRLLLAELQPEEARLLHTHLRRDRRAAVHGHDGYEMLKALTPPDEHRGLVLVDPPYERPTEFMDLVQAMRVAGRRWPEGVYALWYPLKDEPAARHFERELLRLRLRRVLLAEFHVAARDLPGFHACAMALVNPPWQSEHSMDAALGFLRDTLAPGAGSYQLRWLATERT